jgi:hypothetical protein
MAMLLAVMAVVLAVPTDRAVAGTPGAQPAEAVSRCTATTGVLVVVDFRHWSDPVKRGCAPTPTTGYEALHNARYTTAGDDHDGDAFICRIDDLPTPDQDGCVNTPSPPDYWSYWHALAGQSTWSFSSLGAMDYHPPAGSIDAWVFGTTASDPPTFTPAQVRAGALPPATTTSTSTSTSSTTTTPVTTVPTTTTTRGVTTTTRGTTTTTAKPATRSRPPTHHSPAKAKAKRSPVRHRAALSPKHRSRASTPSTSPPTTALRIVNVAAGANKATPSSGGSPVGLIVGLVLVAVVGSVAVVTARRRHRSAG